MSTHQAAAALVGLPIKCLGRSLMLSVALLSAIAPTAWAQTATPTAMLRVACDGAALNAEVTINGEFKGECPVDVPVAAGSLRIRVLKKVDNEREQVFEQEVRMAGGTVKRIDVELGAVQFNAAGQRIAAQRAAEAKAQADRVAADLEKLSATFTANGVSFRMRAIPGGSFMMGSPASEPMRDSDEGPQRRVSVPAFQMGQTEVTQGLWQAVMGSNPSRFTSCGSDCPVEQVSWNDAQTFIQKLNQVTGQQFRLPSEAEWEYAARAGCETPFNVGGQCRSKIEASEANFDGDFTYNGSSAGVYRRQTTRTGSFAANTWGLQDMHGNVWELVEDCFGDYSSAPSNGSAVQSSNCWQRVLRGGSWVDGSPRRLRSANRIRLTPVIRDGIIGFRLARTVF